MQNSFLHQYITIIDFDILWFSIWKE